MNYELTKILIKHIRTRYTGINRVLSSVHRKPRIVEFHFTLRYPSSLTVATTVRPITAHRMLLAPVGLVLALPLLSFPSALARASEAAPCHYLLQGTALAPTFPLASGAAGFSMAEEFPAKPGPFMRQGGRKYNGILLLKF